MPSYSYKNILLFLFIFFTGFHVHAQLTCPSNIDFESGNFNGWVCKTGSVSVVNSQNIINWTATGQVQGRHTIIPSSNKGLDLYGNFPISCPNGSGFSAMLGNSSTGAQAEGIFYTYTIPANVNKFSLIYQYAVVFQDPANHKTEQQPRFQARVVNVSDNSDIGCVSFDFTANGELPGFLVSPRSTSTNVILYKDWTPVTIDLSNYAGKTIQIEFITSDCTPGGHFGYAYIDVNSSCSNTIVNSTICRGDSVATLTAPYGYEAYTWFSDNTFSQIIGNTRALTLNPAPQIGTIFPLVLTPYPGYGCIDTLYASTTIASNPPSNAGADISTCKYQQVQLGSNPNSSYSYEWTPANLISNSSIANPTAFVTFVIPVDFVVKTTDNNTKCFSFDTVKVIPKIVDTSVQISGNVNYCAGNVINTSFKLSPASSNIQWYNNNSALNGETFSNFSPAATGSYWAQLSQNGCTDSTAHIPFTIHPVPGVSYTINKDTQCVTNNSFSFLNTSAISDSSTLFYSWSFGDGSLSQQLSPIKNYTSGGVYNIKLIASSATCADSTVGKVYLLPNATPEFSWDSACTNRPLQFKNITNENGSTAVSYLWDFANNTSSNLKTPVPFTYKDSGVYNVSLKAIAEGCESDPKVIVHNIYAHQASAGIKYPDKTVAAGYTQQIAARNIGNIYKWSPATQLSNANFIAPNFYALNDIKYLITITDKNTCVITDTLQMLVIKKKGIYLPNAFTPNGDGLNDEVRPYIIGMKSFKRFSVYNRWGSLVFNTSKDGEAWNGTNKGIPLIGGLYVWILEYIDADDKTVAEKGSIMLIR